MFKKFLNLTLIASLTFNVSICKSDIDLGTSEQQSQQAEQIKELFLIMKKTGRKFNYT